MTTRVDPAMYSDTPIFQALLEERKGRWPGIPANRLPPVSPVISLVLPLPPYDPERTAPMPLPHVAEG